MAHCSIVKLTGKKTAALKANLGHFVKTMTLSTKAQDRRYKMVNS